MASSFERIEVGLRAQHEEAIDLVGANSMIVRYTSAFLGWLVICLGPLNQAESRVDPANGGPDMARKAAQANGATRTTARITLEERDAGPGTVEVATAGSGASPRNDGASDAAICKVQYPYLLDRYKARPGWRVAGVNYCVGYPADTALKDPPTISMRGVTVDTANKTITVTGNNVTLNGYDLSGWGVSVQAANTRIVNSKFAGNGIWGTSTSSNLYVGYCVIDGQNDADTTALLGTNGVGITVEYCWLKNAAEDMIQVHSGVGGEVTLRYNLFDTGGLRWSEGAHGDFLQMLGGPFTVSILYNTTVQDTGQTSGGFTQGLMMEPDGYAPWTPSITSGEYGYNTMIARGDFTMNVFIGATVSTIVNTVIAHDNYFDPSGASGLAAGGSRGGPNDSSPKTVFVNNVNMVTGAVVQDANPPRKPLKRAP